MNEKLYIESASSLLERYNRLCDIVDALELSLLDEAGKDGIESYKLNDGQVDIQTQYRSVEDRVAGIRALDFLRTRTLNKLNGNSFVLRSARGLR